MDGGRSLRRNDLLIVGTALLWSSSNFAFAARTREMGPVGLIFGWSVYIAAIVLTANVCGSISGECREAKKRARGLAAAGGIVLIAGIWQMTAAGAR
jgi:drug/metabolite transporter (DMT)-like permease